MFTKMTPRCGAAALSVLTALALSGVARAGNLTPPAGNVSGTMKTLDQVEARIPIPGGVNPAPFVITQPGSYYLTGNRVHTQNVSHSIKITVSNVTLDLNGFTIAAQNGGSGAYAIMDQGDSGEQPDLVGIVVRNGIVAGPGWYDAGIALGYTQGSRVENVTAQGIDGTGIYVGEGGLVIDSVATQCDNGFGGDRATFMRCSAYNNRDRGFNLYRSTARECVANNNFTYGFVANYRSVVESCVANDNRPAGPGAGIYVFGDGCRIDSNTLSGNYIGIFLDSAATNAVVTRNSVRPGSGWPYSMTGQTQGNFPNNHVAQVITDPVNQFTSTNTWANFAH